MREEQHDDERSLPTLNAPGLLVMDVDSTLIDEEVIDELGRAAGVGERIAAVTARAMNGELDFKQALRERVQLLAGLPESIFVDVFKSLHFTTGALQLIDTLHEHDWKVGVVSGGFHEVVDMIADAADLDFWVANHLQVEHGVLTGATYGEVVTKDVKRRKLHEWADACHVPLTQTVAVGDGMNDLPMILDAGCGIAFCGKPNLQAQAPNAIHERDLMQVLTFLR